MKPSGARNRYKGDEIFRGSRLVGFNVISRRLWRLVAIGILVIGGASFIATPSLADSTQAGVVQSGYFTKTSDPIKTLGAFGASLLCPLPSPDPRTCLDASSVTGSTPGYPRKDNFIYVARFDGTDDAHGFIEPDLSALPFGATVTSITLDFQIENEIDSGTFVIDDTKRSAAIDPAKPGLAFCYVANGWAGADAAPFESRPDTICKDGPTPIFKGPETRNEPDPLTLQNRPRRILKYTVDLAPIAEFWSEGFSMNGIAVVPAPGSPNSFEIAIRPASAAPDALVFKVEFEGGEDFDLGDIDDSFLDTEEFAFSSDDFGSGDGFTGSDGDINGSLGASPFELGGDAADTAKTSGPITSRASKGMTPWWVWLFFPAAASIAWSLGSGLVAEPVTPGTERQGPVGKLMRRGS